MLVRQIIGRPLTWLQSRLLVVNTRRSKFTVFGAFAVLLFLYIASSYLLPVHKRPSSHHHFETCLDQHLRNWEKQIATGDLVVRHGSEQFMEMTFLALTGNDFLSLVMSGDDVSTHIFLNGTFDTFELPFPTKLTADIQGARYDRHEAVVMNMKTGAVQNLRSYQRGDECLVAEHVLYAHRTDKNVVLQKMIISNYGKTPAEVRFYQTTASNEYSKEKKQSTSLDEEAKEYVIVGGSKTIKKQTMDFVYISSEMEKRIVVPGLTSGSVSQTMVVKAVLRTNKQKSNRKNQDANAEQDKINELHNSANMKYKKLNNLNKLLFEEHLNAIEKTREQRINVESKGDPNTPSPLHVYLVDFYLGMTAPFNSSHSKATEINGKTGACYSGSETMHAADLWVIPTKMTELMKLKSKWISLLKDAGCNMLVSSGFYGLQEAVSLSFSGFHFTPKSLQLAINPLSLQSNVSLENLYSYNHQINIKIEINPSSSRQVIHVQVGDLSNSMLCACGAGCKDIVNLKDVFMPFPVFVTAPVTPILYISSNRSDLEAIQKNEFIVRASKGLSNGKRLDIAGDHFKLSPKFWVAISLLIIGFHVIVVKMIYNECRKEKNRRPGKSFIS